MDIAEKSDDFGIYIDDKSDGFIVQSDISDGASSPIIPIYSGQIIAVVFQIQKSRPGLSGDGVMDFALPVTVEVQRGAAAGTTGNQQRDQTDNKTKSQLKRETHKYLLSPIMESIRQPIVNRHFTFSGEMPDID
jgi:hypothetical protein